VKSQFRVQGLTALVRFVQCFRQMPVGPISLSFATPPQKADPPPRAEAAERGPTVVAATRTKLDGEQAAAALSRAYENVTGRPPSEKTLSLLTAQWAHETGRGASMFNFNFGGIKGVGPSGMSTAQRTREGWGETERVIVDKFRAYRTAEEGATDYVRLLAKRYPDAVQAAERGDAAGFVRGLKARGYFTGNEGAYLRSVQSLATVAQERGFTAIGGAGSVLALSARHVAAARPAPAAPADAGLSEPDALQFVDAFAIADELGRAALRILLDDARRDRERDA
jgi:hypothetical protein